MFETTSGTLMNINRFVSNIKHIREAAPTNSSGTGGFGASASSPVAGYDKYLFPGDAGLLTRDYQTPYGLKWGLSDVVPVKHLTLDDIDTMTNASREFYNKMTAPKPQKSDPMDNVMNIVRSLKEEAPVNNVGGGAIAGAVGGEAPPVFNKKKKPPIIARGLMPGARKRWSKK